MTTEADRWDAEQERESKLMTDCAEEAHASQNAYDSWKAEQTVAEVGQWLVDITPSVWQMAERREALLALKVALTEGTAPGPERTDWFRTNYPTIAAELSDLDLAFAEMDK